MEKKTEIIVLAAGQGKRMQSDLPKVLVQFLGKPFIRHVLDQFTQHDLPSPTIVVGYKKELVMEELGDQYRYAIQTEQLGTGHAVTSAREIVSPDADTIVVLYADQPLLNGKTIKDMIDRHHASGATLTMATVPLPDYDDWRGEAFGNFGRIIRNTDGKIIKNVEAKDATDEEKSTPEVNPCYFCFDANWLWPRLASLRSDNAQGEYYLTDLIGIAFDEGVTIETIPIDAIEALGANTIEQLELMERLSQNHQ